MLLQFVIAVFVVLTVLLCLCTGYLENYRSDKQQIILLHVYNSLDNVKQCGSDSDSEGKKLFIDLRWPWRLE